LHKCLIAERFGGRLPFFYNPLELFGILVLNSLQEIQEEG